MNLIINFFLTSVKEITKYIGHTLQLAEINFLVKTGLGQSTYTANQQLSLSSIFGVKTLKLQHATHVETLPTHTSKHDSNTTNTNCNKFSMLTRGRNSR